MAQRVSVVIPLYNHANYIERAISSVVLQGPIVKEIIIIDDGSTDDSAAVMQSLLSLDARIIFWGQQNRGAHATINAGLLRGTAEFLAILNSDDAYALGRLDRLVAALDLDRGADFAASSIAFMDAAGAEIANPWHDSALAEFKRRGALGPSLVHANFLMTTSNYVLRRSLLDRIGLFAPLRYAHDLDFALRAVANRARMAFVDEPLLSYRFHSTNTIKEDHRGVRREWAMAAAHYHYLTLRHGRPDGPEASDVTAILEQHGLLQAAELCGDYFNRHPTETLERSAILTDPAVNKALADCV